MKRLWWISAGLVIAAGAWWTMAHRSGPAAGMAAGPAPVQTAAGALRLAGAVEATRARTVFVPRLAGQTAQTLVITRLIRAGSRVAEGDPLVEFDPQEQVRAAQDKRAELVDLDGQILKKKSEQAIAQAHDQTELTDAERNVSRAKIGILQNELIAKVEAEKNTLALEQANAKLDQLRKTFALKRTAEAADLETLHIQRARTQRALEYAEGNSQLMSVKAPFPGLVVLKQVWKGNNMGEVAEGEEVRPGLPILDIVDSTSMQVRAYINQADVGLVTPGQPAKVRLDAYPDLLFDGRVELVAPLGVQSSLTPKVRSFVALVSIQGSDPQLMPDLSASVEILPGSPITPPPPPPGTR
jgi:multidrug resistance efflux pump